jgi:hypothetical protein
MLEVANGVWSGNPAPTFAYVWKRNGAPILGVTTSTYEPAGDDVGAMISVTVIASNSVGSASADSNVVAIEGRVGSGAALTPQRPLIR